ncbi:MAG TPA: thiamine pyrophosphate-binding protein, partial [Trichococcus flocculiformis]|nr:thiamine pyrophosphate-binding protein [Trichococcus flocculiformis]
MESEMKTKTKKGVTLLVEALKNEGVEVLFGYPGGAVLHIYDEFYKSESNHVLTRHEQGAV